MAREKEHPPARWRWWRRSAETGQGLAEYGLILTVIAVVCVGAVTTLGVDIMGSAAWTSFAF